MILFVTIVSLAAYGILCALAYRDMEYIFIHSLAIFDSHKLNLNPSAAPFAYITNYFAAAVIQLIRIFQFVGVDIDSSIKHRPKKTSVLITDQHFSCCHSRIIRIDINMNIYKHVYTETSTVLPTYTALRACRSRCIWSYQQFLFTNPQTIAPDRENTDFL